MRGQPRGREHRARGGVLTGCSHPRSSGKPDARRRGRIAGAHDSRAAQTPERPARTPERRPPPPRVGQRFHGEQVAAAMIADRQRVAVASVRQQELSLEVGRPHAVGSGARRCPGPGNAVVSCRSPGPVAIQHGMHRYGRLPQPQLISRSPRIAVRHSCRTATGIQPGIRLMTIDDRVIRQENLCLN